MISKTKSIFLRMLRTVLTQRGYEIYKVNSRYPITKPIKVADVEILADQEFQASVRETKDVTLLDTARLANLWNLCRMTDPEGAIIEIGTFQGGGALHLSNAAPDRKIIVCDPFSDESFQNLDLRWIRSFTKANFVGYRLKASGICWNPIIGLTKLFPVIFPIV